MTTLERNSLFMLEMTTRVLGDCWITSIRKLFLTFLVESAWYEFKPVHMEAWVGFFPLTALNKEACWFWSEFKRKPLKSRTELQAVEPQWLTLAIVWPQFLTLAFVVCNVGAWSCAWFCCLHLCEGIRCSVRSFISSSWQQDERLAIASVLHYVILWSAIMPRFQMFWRFRNILTSLLEEQKLDCRHQ